jgi:hypothetical protein
MKFNIYGRFQVEVRREREAWIVYRAELGKRAKLHEIVVPPDLAAAEIATYLDDVYHEYAGVKQTVEQLAD